jgi:ketosteroid isomerase-like protein
MSQENVEVVRAFTDAFNAGDIEGLVACCDPGVEFHSTFAAVGGAIYHGHDGMRRWHRDMKEIWGGEIRSELEAIYDLGENALVFTVLHGRGQQSGVEVGLPAAMVARSRDGRLVYFKGYGHREDALSDMQVSEDALEPIAPW